MRTSRVFYAKEQTVYSFELSQCPSCQGALHRAYTSNGKTVQTMRGVWRVIHHPSRCSDPDCACFAQVFPSARWLEFAPKHCSYGYDVIAQIGWQRQTGRQCFREIHEFLEGRLQISASEVRHLYHERYLPLLACHERQQLETLHALSALAAQPGRAVS